jgi:hypothetical protein
MIRLVASASILVVIALASVAAAGDARVEVEQGLVSASFDAVPVREALEAVRRASGVEIVVPASVQDQTLTMTVERQPFEQFVRRLLDGLDLGGFALVYESGGAAQRVIVVDRARGGVAAPEPAPPPPAPTGSEPVYIPPATPPVYIPPATPPVYIPPATPPVYIPPSTPPVYIPPATEPRTPSE